MASTKSQFRKMGKTGSTYAFRGYIAAKDKTGTFTISQGGEVISQGVKSLSEATEIVTEHMSTPVVDSLPISLPVTPVVTGPDYVRVLRDHGVSASDDFVPTILKDMGANYLLSTPDGMGVWVRRVVVTRPVNLTR